jgi:hypothetical protein
MQSPLSQDRWSSVHSAAWNRCDLMLVVNIATPISPAATDVIAAAGARYCRAGPAIDWDARHQRAAFPGLPTAPRPARRIPAPQRAVLAALVAAAHGQRGQKFTPGVGFGDLYMNGVPAFRRVAVGFGPRATTRTRLQAKCSHEVWFRQWRRAIASHTRQENRM